MARRGRPPEPPIVNPDASPQTDLIEEVERLRAAYSFEGYPGIAEDLARCAESLARRRRREVRRAS